MKLVEGVSFLGEPLPFLMKLIECALVSHDTEYMINLHENVREDDRRRQVLRKDSFVEAEEVVIRLGVEEEQIGQPLFREKPFEISHIGIADAGGAALEHVEASDFSGAALLMDLEQLADADRQRKTFTAGGVLQPLVELSAVQWNDGAGVEPEPPGCHGKGPGMVRGEVWKVDLHPRVGERHGLAVRPDDTAARNNPAGDERTRGNGLH